MLADLRAGWHEFFSRQWLWVVVAQFSIVVLALQAAHGVLGPLLARDELGGAPAWSAVLAAQAFGMVVGVLVAMRVRPRRPIFVGVLLTFSGAVPSLLLGVGAPLWSAVAGAFLTGVCFDVFGVLWATTMQREVPPESLSRAASYDALGSLMLGPLGLMVAGPAAELAGVRPSLIGCAVLMVLVSSAALLAPGVRGLRAPDRRGAGRARAPRPRPPDRPAWYAHAGPVTAAGGELPGAGEQLGGVGQVRLGGGVVLGEPHPPVPGEVDRPLGHAPLVDQVAAQRPHRARLPGEPREHPPLRQAGGAHRPYQQVGTAGRGVAAVQPVHGQLAAGVQRLLLGRVAHLDERHRAVAGRQRLHQGADRRERALVPGEQQPVGGRDGGGKGHRPREVRRGAEHAEHVAGPGRPRPPGRRPGVVAVVQHEVDVDGARPRVVVPDGVAAHPRPLGLRDGGVGRVPAGRVAVGAGLGQAGPYLAGPGEVELDLLVGAVADQVGEVVPAEGDPPHVRGERAGPGDVDVADGQRTWHRKLPSSMGR